jgi:hypothetical protein
MFTAALSILAEGDKISMYGRLLNSPKLNWLSD